MVRKKFEFKGFIDGVIGVVVTGSMVSEIRARLEVVVRDIAWRVFKWPKNNKLEGCEEKNSP